MKKRSLILAGGGIKVSFQAGVLQVWLDEAGLTFDHVDGASGGVFNLAMMCQGMSGLQIANNWRNLNPRAGVSFNVEALTRLFYAESLFTLNNYRKNVFPGWELDWRKICESKLDGTFNVFNFSTKEIEIISPKDMTEDLLCACVSLPMWFPPVRINNQTYIDAVFLTDANIEEAIRKGADEIWVIWTVSEKDEWHSGFVANYFQIIETTADGHYRAILKRIEANNKAFSAGESGEFGRHIEVKELKADVALHYLIDFSQDRLAETVNLGVKHAREWCAKQNIPLKNAGKDYSTDIHSVETRLSFTETMRGFWTFGEQDCETGFNRGKKDRNAIEFTLTITIAGVNRFVTRPEHDTDLIEGNIECAELGGTLPVKKGWFNLFTDEKDPAVKLMLYRLYFEDGTGRPLTLSGRKTIRDDPGFDLWRDTTTLYSRVYQEHVDEESEKKATLVGSGIITIHFTDFLKQLTTFRTDGPTMSDRNAARMRFVRLFFGKLWDVYARGILTSGPF